jgi:hypothetical protein
MNLEIGQSYNGGTYVGDIDGYRIIVSSKEDGEITGDWKTCKNWCEALDMRGYLDWFLPTAAEMWAIAYSKQSKRILILDSWYWCDAENADDKTRAMAQSAFIGSTGSQMYFPKDRNVLFSARAIRREKI